MTSRRERAMPWTMCTSIMTTTTMMVMIMMSLAITNAQRSDVDTEHVIPKPSVQQMRQHASVDINAKKSDDPVSIKAPKDSNSQSTERMGSDFVQFAKIPPSLQSRKKIKVTYYCQSDSVVVLQVVVMIFGSDAFDVVYTKAWKCRGQGEQGIPRTKSSRLHLPHPYAYRPDRFNHKSLVILSSKVKVYLVSRDEYTRARESRQVSSLASNHKDTREISSLPPYSRPPYIPPCPVWYWPLLQKKRHDQHILSCEQEAERMTLLDYPSVFHGGTQGILRKIPRYRNAVLEGNRIQTYRRPKLSLEVWFYVLDYCPRYHMNNAEACGIVLHSTTFNALLSPTILINKHGQIQIDVEGPNGIKGIKTVQIVPKNVWVRLLFSLDYRTWHLYVNYGTGMRQGFTASFIYDEDVFCDDTAGFFSVGGIGDTMGSFVGYIGRVVLYRRRILKPGQLNKPDLFHPMYRLGLTGRDERCQKFLTWLDSTIGVYTKYYKYRQTYRSDRCLRSGLTTFGLSSTCPRSHIPREKQYRHLGKLLKKAVATQRLAPHGKLDGASVMEAYGKGTDSRYSASGQLALYNVSRGLMDKALSVVTRSGLRKAGRMVTLLKQSACLGNDDAMFYLAAMLNNGVGVATDEIQSLAFFMLGTLNGHPLSSMALGFRHSMGMDGAPVDYDIAYMYYKTVADKCRRDREEHKDAGYHPENVRLIDEKVLRLQTSEAGDLFMWLKDQAAKGVQSARSDIAELMYWGKQGIQRNLQNALNVYREGAQDGNVASMYNYGVMTYRGIGGKVNKTEGKKLMKRAAEKRSPDALNALGWISLEVDKNYTAAAELFRQAKHLGHMDAGYFLGHMYMFGFIPDSPVNYDKALEEYQWSAIRQQIHAGTLFSFLLSRGTPKYPRNIYNAVLWAQFIAEQNAALGKPLRAAVDAYRYGKMDESLYLYLILAETGLEVASFNVAYLCEMNSEGVTSYISKECQWKHYNLTIQREFKNVDPYSYLKMGDYYWYGCQNKRDLENAAKFYALAVLKRDPQALFNLAYMVEEGAAIPPEVWRLIGIHDSRVLNSTYATLVHLYTRCRESKKSEAYLPCSLALARIQVLETWANWCQYFNVKSLLGVMAALFVTVFIVCQWVALRLRRMALRIRRRRLSPEDREGEEGVEGDVEGEGEERGDGQTNREALDVSGEEFELVGEETV